MNIYIILLILFFSPPSYSDPDPIQDFCVPDAINGNGPNGNGIPSIQLTHLYAYPCKNPLNVTAADFTFSNITSPSTFSPSTGFAGAVITPLHFPALHTLGMSFARADLDLNGVNPPHYHPRATETALVLEGTIYSGFVDSAGRIYAKVLRKGEVTVFPRGMVHFQMNVGEGMATIFGSFNSENPGLVRLPLTVFGSGIKEELLEKAFGLSPKEIQRLNNRFRPI